LYKLSDRERGVNFPADETKAASPADLRKRKTCKWQRST